MKQTWLFIALICLTISLHAQKGIHPSATQPQYWSYNGENILLLGGSSNDNLFQNSNLEEELDLIKSVGGNYVRNVMSSRDEGDLWPFAQTDEGLYDLKKWNDDYWERFDNFLRLTTERDIIVQIEVWATFDFYRDNWDINPFNPKNNINYDTLRSKLSEKVETHPIFTHNNFFRSVPSQMSLAVVLEPQAHFVEKLLSYSLQYDHVLYCMDNETSVTADWGIFWAKYIKKHAALANKKVYCTEMWDPWELSHPFHAVTFDNDHIFDFIDISQNNHIHGERHWDNAMLQIERLKKTNKLRPINNVKIYGNDGGAHHNSRQALESFGRNVMMGCASARFHRPTSGQGINENAQAFIDAFRKVSQLRGFFDSTPRNDLLLNRAENEAYCRALEGELYIVFFTGEGEVDIDLKKFGSGEITWVNILEGVSHTNKIKGGKPYKLTSPGTGYWLVTIN